MLYEVITRALSRVFDDHNLLERRGFALRGKGINQLLNSSIETLKHRYVEKDALKKEDDLLAKDIRGNDADDKYKDNSRNKPEPRRMIPEDLEIDRLKYAVNKPKEPSDGNRITSYNVCYTKLLRIDFFFASFSILVSVAAPIPRDGVLMILRKLTLSSWFSTRRM